MSELRYEAAKTPLDTRLDQLVGEASDALLMMEQEINHTVDAEELKRIALRASSVRLMAEHVQKSAMEKSA